MGQDQLLCYVFLIADSELNIYVVGLLSREWHFVKSAARHQDYQKIILAAT